MNARLAIERSEELKASFLNQAKSNAEAHNRDLFVEIERLKKSFFKMYGLSACTIEELVSEVVVELSQAKEDIQTEMKQPCNDCDRVHGSDCVIATNRFSKNDSDKKYKANLIGSIERETKQEAEKDYCNYYEQTRNNKA